MPSFVTNLSSIKLFSKKILNFKTIFLNQIFLFKGNISFKIKEKEKEIIFSPKPKEIN
jgi:hypothetical protein